MNYSIIIPAFNASGTLGECLKAVGALESRVNVCEVIVVDDGSSDDTSRVAQDFGAKVIRNEKPLGPAAARNTGAKAADAEILLFVDADIILPQEALTEYDRFFETNPSVTAVVGSRSPVSYYKNIISRYKSYWTAYNWSCGARSRVLNSSALAFKKNAFVELGGFDESIKEAFYEDDELGLRMSDKGYEIGVAVGVKAVHIKHYSFRTLLARDMNTDYAKYEVRSGRLATDLRKFSYSSVAPHILISFPFMLLVVVALIVMLAAGTNSRVTAVTLIFGFSLLIGLNRPFWNYVAGAEKFKLKTSLFVLIFFAHIFCVGIAQLVGYAKGILEGSRKKQS